MSADPMRLNTALPFGRRQLLAGLATSLLAPHLAIGARAPQRLISLDYGLASTAMALGVVPKAIAAGADWDRWVIEPPLPPEVADLGSPWEVNFEIISALKPDLILNTPYGGALTPRLEEIAPVLQLEVYTADGGDILPKAVAATRKLGEALGRGAEAEQFILEADAFFDACRERIAKVGSRPLAMVYFMDPRHVRIYTSPGLYANVLTRIGLTNAWSKPGNFWGFETIPIENLAEITDPEARLVAFDPLLPDVLPILERSPLWQALPFARPGHLTVLPGSLMFGMLSDAMRFARIMTDYAEASA
ncbi:iron-siderophore ABC transporter substrate-binding protein [Rhizobium sp. CECT 9324]|uniref:iron-siderophore ABC transporter substrate-binding protein n=1 Tax=Rhizobium sp. CECT 9324 TaxID=2845820 RepID=UPI001E5339DC|nr:iron-siderophore ABC transporter substrate-binding protein [Rhizobium sp. CECT 9324]CAH0338686.1 Iron(3+)-hydroxamate-binding protein FhuD [Rhizobium sp. CECT 9324]